MTHNNKFLVGACHLKASTVIRSSHFCQPSQCLQKTSNFSVLNVFKENIHTTQSHVKQYLELEINMDVRICR